MSRGSHPAASVGQQGAVADVRDERSPAVGERGVGTTAQISGVRALREGGQAADRSEAGIARPAPAVEVGGAAFEVRIPLDE